MTSFFWIDTAERAAKSFAQALLTYFGAAALNVFSVNWLDVLGIGLGAAVLSVLFSLASLPISADGTASARAVVIALLPSRRRGKHEG